VLNLAESLQEALVTPAAITVGFDPIIARLGHIHIGWYGVITMLALAVALQVSLHEARRRGFQSDDFWTVAIWAVIGGFVGARMFHVVDRWSVYGDDPASIFALQRGGLAIVGAILGGLVAGMIAAWWKGLKVFSLADAAAPGIILGQAIGRLGCLFTGDALGGPTTLPWGVVYTNPASMAPELGVAFHPVFAYEGLWGLTVFAALWLLRPRLHRPGTLFASYLALYASGKFMLTFLRQERVWFWELQEAHLLALVLLAMAAVLLLWRSRAPGPPVQSNSPVASVGES
jgi:phosphatidylglycerol---prolipoprotein diacylglyceryl transferase